MHGTIISVTDVPLENGGTFPSRTVVYERDGKRYRGAVTYQGRYYFGGGCGHSSLFLSDVDAAWEQTYSPTAKVLSREKG